MNATTPDRIYKSACRMCHGGCGVLVHVNDGRISKIVGDPDSPLNRGKICIKAPASIELVNHPDRLRHPLKRAGSRGEGKWTEITWDEALETAVSWLKPLRETDQSKTTGISD